MAGTMSDGYSELLALGVILLFVCFWAAITADPKKWRH